MRWIRAGLFVFLGVIALSASAAHGSDLNGYAIERKFGGEANLSYLFSRICTGLQRTPHTGSAQNEPGLALVRLVFGEWCDPSLDGIDPIPEDGEAFHYGERRIAKSAIVASRVLINGAPIAASVAPGHADTYATPTDVVDDRPEGLARDRWDVSIETGDETILVECGAIRERISQDLARLVFGAVKGSIEGRGG